ncbi:MAG: lysophospholipid acyltransferase family protein [Verrucomicrobiota bacterium]
MKAPVVQDGMGLVYAVSRLAAEAAHGAFFRGELIGLGNVPRTGPFLLAANHASFLDPPLIGCHVLRPIAYFARKTLWKPGPAAWWLDAVGCIPVDRDGSDVAAIKNVLRALTAGRALVLFPEGTRSADGVLQTPKAGVGLLACRAQVPVVPTRIFNSHRALGRDGALHLGTPVSVVYGRSLMPADYDDPVKGKARYQHASEKIMSAIAALREPEVVVV